MNAAERASLREHRRIMASGTHSQDMLGQVQGGNGNVEVVVTAYNPIGSVTAGPDTIILLVLSAKGFVYTVRLVLRQEWAFRASPLDRDAVEIDWLAPQAPVAMIDGNSAADWSDPVAVSYTHLTLPTNREV